MDEPDKKNKEYLGQIHTFLNKLKENKYQIAMVGQIKVGKSTLMNALLGEEILGMATLPETATLSRIKYGKEKKAIALFFNTDDYKQLKNIAKENAPVNRIIGQIENEPDLKDKIRDEAYSMEIPIDQLKKYTGAHIKPPYAAIIKKVDIQYPNRLCEKDIILVDTPGLDDPNTARSKVTNQYLGSADAIVVVYTANQPFKESEKQFLKETIRRGWLKKLFVVVNKIDTINPNEIEEVINYIHQNLEDVLQELKQENLENSEIMKMIEDFNTELAGVKICKMNAKIALEGVLRKNPVVVKQSYYDEFTNELEKLIFDNEKNLQFMNNHIEQVRRFTIQQKIKGQTFSRSKEQDLHKIQEEYEILLRNKNKFEEVKKKCRQAIEMQLENFPLTIDEHLKNSHNLSKRDMQNVLKRLMKETSATSLGNKDFKKRLSNKFQSTMELHLKKLQDNLEKEIQKKLKQIEEVVKLYISNFEKDFQNQILKCNNKNLFKLSTTDTCDSPWDQIGLGLMSGFCVGAINIAIGEFLALGSGIFFASAIPYLGWIVAGVVSIYNFIKFKDKTESAISKDLDSKIDEIYDKVKNGFTDDSGERIPPIAQTITDIKNRYYQIIDNTFEQSYQLIMNSLKKIIDIKKVNETKLNAISNEIVAINKKLDQICTDIDLIAVRYRSQPG